MKMSIRLKNVWEICQVGCIITLLATVVVLALFLVIDTFT